MGLKERGVEVEGDSDCNSDVTSDLAELVRGGEFDDSVGG